MSEIAPTKKVYTNGYIEFVDEVVDKFQPISRFPRRDGNLVILDTLFGLPKRVHLLVAKNYGEDMSMVVNPESTVVMGIIEYDRGRRKSELKRIPLEIRELLPSFLRREGYREPICFLQYFNWQVR